MSTISLQLERPDGLLELDQHELGLYAESLARSWRQLGVKPGDRVLVYDYSASPVACLASQAFIPYLETGAAEATSSQVLCIDGLTDNAKRVAHVTRYFKPDWLFARADTVPLLTGGPTGVPRQDRSAKLIVTADGEVPASIDRRLWEKVWKGGVGMLVRWDPVAFIAPECPTCRHLQVQDDLYNAKVDQGQNGEDGWGLLEVESRIVSHAPALTEIEARTADSASCCGAASRFEVR